MLAPGTIIDSKYCVVDALGGGGFGLVYVANQDELGRKVAIKVLNRNSLEVGEVLPRFEREAKAINRLKHKNIVSFYGYGVWDGAPYMVMEVVDGQPLSKITEAEQKLEPKHALAIFRQVFEGLECAHASGIVHRDLKPSNIMVSADDQVKLIDFGLAKLIQRDEENPQKLTATGFTVGSVHYMAPEQALGGAVDERSDIYSAGLILYQVLTAHYPFETTDSVAVMYQQVNQLPRPVCDLVGRSPLVNALSAFVDNCIAKDPDARYQSCGEAIADLNAIAAGNFRTVRKAAKRKRPIPAFAVAALAIAVVSLVMGLAWIRFNDEASQRTHDALARQAEDAATVRRSSEVHLGDPQQLPTMLAIEERDSRGHYLTPFYKLLLLQQLASIYARLDREGPEWSANRARSLAYVNAGMELERKFPEWQGHNVDNLWQAAWDAGDDDTCWRLSQIMLKTGNDVVQDGRRGAMFHYLAKHDLKKAREYGDAALHAPRGDISCRLDVATLLVDIDLLDGRTADATEDLANAMTIFDKVNSEQRHSYRGDPNVHVSLARLYLLQGRYADALRNAQDGQRCWKEDNYVTEKAVYLPAAQMEIAALAAQGKTSEARRLFDSLKDKHLFDTRFEAVAALDRKLLHDRGF